MEDLLQARARQALEHINKRMRELVLVEHEPQSVVEPFIIRPKPSRELVAHYNIISRWNR